MCQPRVAYMAFTIFFFKTKQKICPASPFSKDRKKLKKGTSTTVADVVELTVEDGRNGAKRHRSSPPAGGTAATRRSVSRGPARAVTPAGSMLSIDPCPLPTGGKADYNCLVDLPTEYTHSTQSARSRKSLFHHGRDSTTPVAACKDGRKDEDNGQVNPNLPEHLYQTLSQSECVRD